MLRWLRWFPLGPRKPYEIVGYFVDGGALCLSDFGDYLVEKAWRNEKLGSAPRLITNRLRLVPWWLDDARKCYRCGKELARYGLFDGRR